MDRRGPTGRKTEIPPLITWTHKATSESSHKQRENMLWSQVEDWGLHTCTTNRAAL